ncbi:hypothetical protein DENSPDRAFT_680529 [Dentipellis sp. KUC8613]|nr:hypothetical protein DENSPDRAFT_680529 [Dentipellis sp. KUC8613]
MHMASPACDLSPASAMREGHKDTGTQQRSVDSYGGASIPFHPIPSYPVLQHAGDGFRRHPEIASGRGARYTVARPIDWLCSPRASSLSLHTRLEELRSRSGVRKQCAEHAGPGRSGCKRRAILGSRRGLRDGGGRWRCASRARTSSARAWHSIPGAPPGSHLTAAWASSEGRPRGRRPRRGGCK